ncbi:hypothetical protein IQ235_05270 [Oscillatoriales cyanobacterium LEGE 11467]|uniref:Uncharacterized protein n=1 Tax=Zarconia navalis LEGE 11467 TaxID=1828826 RepID=A0A928VWU3_9CYAN|nr:hypothetical protein [Zarconia navalis]MBE9040202.1 hypothetical protein [Zarconia navalis LEGE 11467]
MGADFSKYRDEVLRLRQMGISTPEICGQLGLSSDIVIELIIGASSIPPIIQEPEKHFSTRPRGRPRQVWEEAKVEKVFDLLSRPATVLGYRSQLWTLPRLVEGAAKHQLGLSKRMLRRYLTRLGLTFSDQLEQCSCKLPLELNEVGHSKSAMLYLVREFHAQDFGLEYLTPAVALVGLTPSNRIALAVHHRHRVLTDFVEFFLRELLVLHADKHIVVVVPGKGEYRCERLRQFVSGFRRLHLYELG